MIFNELRFKCTFKLNCVRKKSQNENVNIDTLHGDILFQKNRKTKVEIGK